MNRKLLFAFLATMYLGNVLAQDVVYFDSENRRVANATLGEYYRIITQENETFKFEDHYISGGVKMIGHSLYRDSLVDNGYFTYFDKAGRKTREGGYLANKPVGLHILYYKDTTIVHMKQTFDNEGGYMLESYYLDGKLKRKEIGTNKGNPTGTCYDEDGKEMKFTAYQVPGQPTFDISSFLSMNLRYPDAARSNGIEGRVILKFDIDVDGTLKNIGVMKSRSKALEEEALRVVNAMPLWKPAKEDDVPVKVYYTLPIVFILE